MNEAEIENLNESLLIAVANGDSSTVAKLLESELACDWVGSEYVKSEDPSINPIISSIGHIDGKNSFKEFLLRFEDLLLWDFSGNGNTRNILSIAIEMQNIEILSHIKTENPASWFIDLNRKNQYGMNSINYLGLADPEFIKEFLDLIEDDSQEFLIKNNDRILTGIIHNYFINNISLKDVNLNLKGYLDLGVDFNSEDNRFLKTVSYYVQKNLEEKIVNKVVKIDPLLEMMKELNKKHDKKFPTLYEKLENLNKIYNENTENKNNLDYNLGFMTSFNLKDFGFINNSDLVKSRIDFHQGMLAGIKNKFKTSLLTDNIDFKQLYEIKNNPKYINFLQSKIDLNNDPLFKDFLLSFMNNYSREYVDIFREKYEIINSIKTTDLIVENIKKPRL